MKETILKIYRLFGKIVLKPILNFEYKKQKIGVNERPVEYEFAFRKLRELGTGNILDIGPGQSSFPHLLRTCGFKVTAIDKVKGYWSDYWNRHFKIINDDITNPKTDDTFQFITCLSVLEHIPNHKSAIANMYKLLESGGYLLLSFPYNEKEYHQNIYEHPDAGYGKDSKFITQIYSRDTLDSWIKETPFKIISQEYYKTFTGELWTFGERLIPCVEAKSTDPHHLTCLLLQKL